MRKIISRYKRPIVVTATILYLSLVTLLSLVNISPPDDSLKIEGLDKVVHFCFYFGMNALFQLTLLVYNKCKSWHLPLIATLCAIAYSFGIEIIQGQVGRSFDLMDTLANSLGALAALSIHYLYTSVLDKKFLSKTPLK